MRTPWEWTSTLSDIWAGDLLDRAGLQALARRRFAAIVEHARAHSRFYADLYRDLPIGSFEARDVPPVRRAVLMDRFDDWVTDPRIDRRSVEEFAADPARIGLPYLDRYAVWTSSGTTGEPGLYVHDEDALAVYEALDSMRLARGARWVSFGMNLMMSSGGFAMAAAAGGHFAGEVTVERARRMNPALAGRLRVFSILDPLASVVDSLNAYAPSLLATYPTAGVLLAAEQAAGRLHIRPAAVCLGGETTTPTTRAAIGDAFDCPVLESYGASECMSIACACDRGWLHVNEDWAMLEPVDRDYRPVPAGTVSHTVLVTDFANRVQPIIRYDLGDSVFVKPEPCECGSRFAAVRVEGRSDETLRMGSGSGKWVDLLPLALSTVLEDFGGAHRFQVVQTAPDALTLRLEAPPGIDPGRHRADVAKVLRAWLVRQGLPAVKIRHDRLPPQRSATSGKLRHIIGLPAAAVRKTVASPRPPRRRG